MLSKGIFLTFRVKTEVINKMEKEIALNREKKWCFIFSLISAFDDEQIPKHKNSSSSQFEIESN